MKNRTNIVILTLIVAILCGCKSKRTITTEKSKNPTEAVLYSDYFTNGTMRYDFYHSGDSDEEYYTFDCVKREGAWAGSKIALINPFDYGEQFFRIIDAKSNKIIFKNNYCTLFNEWQTTPEAATVHRSFPEGVIFPEPKNDFIIEIYARNKITKEMEKKHSHLVKVTDYNIRPYRSLYSSVEIHIGGNIENCLDIVLLPDGFTTDEKDKFMAACEMWCSSLFTYSPFKENKNRINIRAVWAASDDSGISEPGHGKWHKTLLNVEFFTFGSERYQMTSEFQTVRDLASNVPYESIFILTNTDKYGGGGIYNFYGLGSAGKTGRTGEVYVHEFGHSLMGLGDEYVEVGNTVSAMYPADKEPWEANLTTFVNFKGKWENMISQDTPIPTPFEEGMLTMPQEKLTIGAYEGGGYLERGIYRPTPQCMMNQLRDFCPVCQKAIIEYLNYLCQ